MSKYLGKASYSGPLGERKPGWAYGQFGEPFIDEEMRHVNSAAARRKLLFTLLRKLDFYSSVSQSAFVRILVVRNVNRCYM